MLVDASARVMEAEVAVAGSAPVPTVSHVTSMPPTRDLLAGSDGSG